MRTRATARAGFTLIELLAVLTIIAVLISLMLPALRTSREAARRSQCMNNLKQIALALHNYENSHNVFPPGVVDTRGPIHNRPDGLHIAWTVQILPFMEQNGVYQAIDPDLSVYAPENSTAAATIISSLTCPSDPRPTVPQPGVPLGWGWNSYAACHNDVEAPIDVNNHGVFFLNSSVRREAITDGTSFTIFVSEKVYQPGDLVFWMSGTRATLRNTGTPINAPTPSGDDVVGGFSSRHFDGANVCFGDGSVRFLTERIDPAVYRLLGRRDDGEPVSDRAFDY